MQRRVALLLTLALLVSPVLHARRRAVHRPGLPDPSSPAAWLMTNARLLQSTELSPVRTDLEPLRTIAGSATVVGLGDGTHGTHEFTTIKQRVIDFMAREMDFDTVAIEAPFPMGKQLDTYVHGGPGDPRAILRDNATRLAYWFWYTEEFLALVEWMRAYNAQRGSRPALSIVGADVYDDATNISDVLAYLRTVDPPAAATAESDYACVPASPGPWVTECRVKVNRVRTDLAAREAQYTAASSARAFHDALRAASVIFHDDRDTAMAEGTLWAREHRSTTGKVFYWAHNEHVTRVTRSLRPAGAILHAALANRYVPIATMNGQGSFVAWRFNGTTKTYDRLIRSFAPIPANSYPWYFQHRTTTAQLIPLRGNVPSWLSTEAGYQWGGSEGSVVFQKLILPDHFDAVLYLDRTRPFDSVL